MTKQARKSQIHYLDLTFHSNVPENATMQNDERPGLSHTDSKYPQTIPNSKQARINLVLLYRNSHFRYQSIISRREPRADHRPKLFKRLPSSGYAGGAPSDAAN